MTAEEVAEDAIKYCLIFRIPEAVLTDRVTNFTSKLIESLWERFNVHTLQTTAYHPQVDGITERFNRTVKIMLAQFVDQHKQYDWDLKLEKLCFAFNAALCATNKFSPFELMSERIPKLPIDLVYDQTDSNELRDKIAVEWIASIPPLLKSISPSTQKVEMKAMFNWAAINRDEAALRASALINRTVRCANYHIGDKVWIMDENHQKGINPKLRPKWKGPFTITEIKNGENARAGYFKSRIRLVQFQFVVFLIKFFIQKVVSFIH